MSKTTPKNKTTLYIVVATVVLIWKGFPPSWIPAARTILPAIAITMYVYMRGLSLPSLSDNRWLWYGLMGFLGMTAPFYLQAKGQVHVESGLASILINGGMPLFTIILAHFFVKSEPLSWRKFSGFIIGFIGVVFLFLPENLSWDLVNNWDAQSLILLVALSYAFAAIVAKRAPETPASVGAAIMLITAAITAIVLALGTGIPEGTFPTGVIVALFALAIFYTGLSDILYLKTIELSGPSMIAKVNYIVPGFSLVFGMIFLNEAFSWRSLAAMTVIIVGLLIARADEPSDDE